MKPISKNRKSLYLDFYPAIPSPITGSPTRREFLGIYVDDKARTPLSKQHNKEMLQLAELLKSKRQNELNKPEIYTDSEKHQLRMKEIGEKNFLEYFKILTNERKTSNHDNWVSAYKYLEKFSEGKLRFADLNERLCEYFKMYLLNAKSNARTNSNLAQNSAASYFNKFKASLKQAYKDGFLQTDLNARVPSIKEAETKRQFLTTEELDRLVKTDCKDLVLKRAALFSALTGMRFGDIKKMTWNEIEYIEGSGYFIHFTQEKTKAIEVMPISDQAFSLLGERKEGSRRVFEGLVYSAYSNKHLATWIGLAGISKDITFHCFRHTFATLQLSHGTDIYTVSKMLGHKYLKTTQIYAKIIDKTKREAANRINLNM